MWFLHTMAILPFDILHVLRNSILLRKSTTLSTTLRQLGKQLFLSQGSQNYFHVLCILFAKLDMTYLNDTIHIVHKYCWCVHQTKMHN
jgi:hypothetical protein